MQKIVITTICLCVSNQGKFVNHLPDIVYQNLFLQLKLHDPCLSSIFSTQLLQIQQL